VFHWVHSSIADFAEEMFGRGNIPHQNRLCFSLPAGRQVCYFLLQRQKKVESLHAAGAVFFACLSHYDAFSKTAKNKALEEHAIGGVTRLVISAPSPCGEERGNV